MVPTIVLVAVGVAFVDRWKQNSVRVTGIGFGVGLRAEMLRASQLSKEWAGDALV